MVRLFVTLTFCLVTLDLLFSSILIWYNSASKHWSLLLKILLNVFLLRTQLNLQIPAFMDSFSYISDSQQQPPDPTLYCSVANSTPYRRTVTLQVTITCFHLRRSLSFDLSMFSFCPFFLPPWLSNQPQGDEVFTSKLCIAVYSRRSQPGHLSLLSLEAETQACAHIHTHNHTHTQTDSHTHPISMHQMHLDSNTHRQTGILMTYISTHTYTWKNRQQQVDDSRQLWRLNSEVLSWRLNLAPHDPQA